MSDELSFEAIVKPLEEQLKNLKKNLSLDSPLLEQLNVLDKQINKMLKTIYSNLEPWQRVLIARHSNRPTGVDYIKKLIRDFIPLSGDRTIFDDKAITCGIGKFENTAIAVIGHDKGKDTNERIENNFGMAHPEGYRKVVRLFELANKFNLPIVAFIDTKGAAANKSGEERGQSYALANCIRANFRLEVPLISVIVGEGGSGGAIALASGHSLLMLKYSVFSVASPDACAAILWKNRSFWKEAANALKITSESLLKFGVIDKIIDEPIGGAHRFSEKTFDNVSIAINCELKKLTELSVDRLKTLQKEKFMRF